MNRWKGESGASEEFGLIRTAQGIRVDGAIAHNGEVYHKKENEIEVNNHAWCAGWVSEELNSSQL